MLNHTLPNTTSSYGRNFSATNASDDEVIPEGEIAAIRVCHSLLGTVGFLENIGVVFVLLSNIMMLDFPSNWFVLSLASADAVTCIALNVLVNLCLNSCQNVEIDASSFRFLAMVTTGSLFTITFNRFLSVYNSLRYPAIMTTSRARFLVLIVWTTASVLSPAYELIPQLSYVVGTYYGLLITWIIILNMYMLKQARDKTRERKRLESRFLCSVKAPRAKYFTKERALPFRLLILFLTFIASSIPLMVLAHVYHSKETRTSVSIHKNVSWCLLTMQLNAIIDPLVYSIDHPIFRRYVEKVKNHLFSRNKTNPSVFFNKDGSVVKIYLRSRNK